MTTGEPLSIVSPEYDYDHLADFRNAVGAATGLASFAHRTGSDIQRDVAGAGAAEVTTAAAATGGSGVPAIQNADQIGKNGIRVKRDGSIAYKRPALDGGDARKRRALAVKKVMKENPEMSLGEASKYVKANNVKY